MHVRQACFEHAEAAFLLVQLVIACCFRRQLDNDFDSFFDFCFYFNDQIRPALFDRIDLAIQANAHRIELASRDAKPKKKVALEIVEFSTRLHRRKETTLSAPVQFSIRVQYRRLPISKRRTGLVGEDGAITHEWHRGLFAPDSWRIVFRTNANTFRR